MFGRLSDEGLSHTTPPLNLSDCSTGGESLTSPVMESVTLFGSWGVSFINPVLKSAWSFVGWGVSFTRPLLESVSSFGAWGVCLTRPVTKFVCSSGGWWFYLQVSRWSLSGRSSVGTSLLHVGVGVSPTHPLMESVSSVSWWTVSLTRPLLESVWMFVGLGVSPTSPVWESVSSFGTWEVCLTRPVLVCPVVCQVRSFSYTPRAGICLVIQLVGSLSYTPRAVWLFVGLEVSPKRTVL